MEMTLRGKCNERRMVFFPRTNVLRTNWADRGYDFGHRYTSGRYAVAVVVTATAAIKKVHLDEPAVPRADVDATARCRQGGSPIGESNADHDAWPRRAHRFTRWLPKTIARMTPLDISLTYARLRRTPQR